MWGSQKLGEESLWQQEGRGTGEEASRGAPPPPAKWPWARSLTSLLASGFLSANRGSWYQLREPHGTSQWDKDEEHKEYNRLLKCERHLSQGPKCPGNGASIRRRRMFTRQRGGMRWEVGGRVKREGRYVYLWLIYVDLWQKPIQYYKAVILQLKTNFKKSKDECLLWESSLHSNWFLWPFSSFTISK